MNNNSILRRSLPYKFYNASMGIIIVNIALFFLSMLSRDIVYYLAMIPSFVIGKYWVWQFVTYMFMHSGISHILFNMLALFFFGFQLERRLGSSEFLLFYLVCGTLAGFFSFIVYYLTGQNVILLGASGAVYAVLLAYATYFPDNVIYVFGILPVKAPILVLVYTAIALFSQVTGSGSGVAHLTHLAGFGFAYLYLLIRQGLNPIQVFRGGGNRYHWH